MIWGKLVEGRFEPAPDIIREGDTMIMGFTDDFLKERGYKPMYPTLAEKEGQLDYYKETETEIIQYWK